MAHNSVFLTVQFLAKRSQMQSSLASLIIAVVKRNSVEYTYQISFLSGTQFTLKKTDFSQ